MLVTVSMGLPRHPLPLAFLASGWGPLAFLASGPFAEDWLKPQGSLPHLPAHTAVSEHKGLFCCRVERAWFELQTLGSLLDLSKAPVCGHGGSSWPCRLMLPTCYSLFYPMHPQTLLTSSMHVATPEQTFCCANFFATPSNKKRHLGPDPRGASGMAARNAVQQSDNP